MPQLSPPRIRMPRVTLPGRLRRATVARTSKAAAKPKQGSRAAEATPAATTTSTKPAATKAGAAAKAPDPNLQERMEGLQGWMAEIERRQGRITYFGAVAVVIALAAAGASLYFALTARNDSAKKSDLDALTKRVDALQSAVTKSSKDTQNTLNASTATLQQSISSLQKKQAQNAATISALQKQVAASATRGAATGTSITPGTTTTTPKKP